MCSPNQSSERNAFLSKLLSRDKFKNGTIEKLMNKKFYCHHNEASLGNQMSAIAECDYHREQTFLRGFGALGLENLVLNLSNENSVVVVRSLKKLKNETSNYLSLPYYLKRSILQLIFVRSMNYFSSNAIEDILTIVLNLSRDFKVAQMIVNNRKLMKDVFNLISQPLYEEICALILPRLRNCKLLK
jgi:hypothetical protein